MRSLLQDLIAQAVLSQLQLRSSDLYDEGTHNLMKQCSVTCLAAL